MCTTASHPYPPFCQSQLPFNITFETFQWCLTITGGWPAEGKGNGSSMSAFERTVGERLELPKSLMCHMTCAIPFYVTLICTVCVDILFHEISEDKHEEWSCISSDMTVSTLNQAFWTELSQLTEPKCQALNWKSPSSHTKQTTQRRRWCWGCSLTVRVSITKSSFWKNVTSASSCRETFLTICKKPYAVSLYTLILGTWQLVALPWQSNSSSVSSGTAVSDQEWYHRASTNYLPSLTKCYLFPEMKGFLMIGKFTCKSSQTFWLHHILTLSI